MSSNQKASRRADVRYAWNRLRELFPSIPARDALRVINRMHKKGVLSGGMFDRVILIHVWGHIRHSHTNYMRILRALRYKEIGKSPLWMVEEREQAMEDAKCAARTRVRPQVIAVFESWRAPVAEFTSETQAA